MRERGLHVLGCRSELEKSEGREGCGRSGRVCWGQGPGLGRVGCMCNKGGVGVACVT